MLCCVVLCCAVLNCAVLCCAERREWGGPEEWVAGAQGPQVQALMLLLSPHQVALPFLLHRRAARQAQKGLVGMLLLMRGWWGTLPDQGRQE